MHHLTVIISFIMFSSVVSFCQTDEVLGLHSEGGAWSFYPAAETNDTLPKVLLIGNSVMNGYHGSVIDNLKRIATIDYWLTPKHLNSEHLLSDLAKVVSYREYHVVHFNIGLHGWPKGRIADEDYVPLLEKYVQTIRENSETTQLIWASITPVTETGKPELNAEINPVIAERNRLARAVMNKYGVQVNDLYGLLEDKLHLSRSDRFHWNATAYNLMGKQSSGYILGGLKLQGY